MTANSYKKIALIGGIASGKSIVSGIMSELGAYIIDADVVAREVVAHGTDGEKKLIKAFPTCVVDGAVDRRKLRELVFSDKTMLEKLNGITHPLIKKRIAALISGSDGVSVTVMPLPFDLKNYDVVVSVYALPLKRINRLVLRDNISMQTAQSMISAQWSDQKMLTSSDFVFVNDGDLTKIRAAVEEWWHSYV
mgnify:FL=1